MKDRYRRLLERDGVGDGDMTRRRLVGALGGAALAAPLFAASDDEPKPEASGLVVVGAGATGRAVAGFIGKVSQVGAQLTAFGYLTALLGVKENRLFTAARGTDFHDPNSADESQARFTVHAESEITSLSVVGRPGGAVGDLGNIVAHATGTLAIHHRKNGGADFDDPDSFRSGSPIATFEATFQDNLTLQPPDFLALASVALVGHLIQKSAPTFLLDGRQTRLGTAGVARSLNATGWGELVDPGEPRSTLWIAGTLAVIGSDK